MTVYVMAFFFPLTATVKRITGRFKKERKDNLTKTLWYYNKIYSNMEIRLLDHKRTHYHCLTYFYFNRFPLKCSSAWFLLARDSYLPTVLPPLTSSSLLHRHVDLRRLWFIYNIKQAMEERVRRAPPGASASVC